MKKSWLMLALAFLCVGSVMAAPRSGASKMKPGQVVRIKEVTDVNGKNNYLISAKDVPKVGAPRFSVSHSDSYLKDSVKGWHYFDVAYDVATVMTDKGGTKKYVMMLPEVQITFAAIYDMTKSKLAGRAIGPAKQGAQIVGWDNPKEQQYAVFTSTYTYQNVTAGRMHYAAVCVHPGLTAVYGEPIAFSAAISFDGELQEIKTSFSGKAKLEGKALPQLLFKGRDEPLAWWESAAGSWKSVIMCEGALRDRSLTPFSMVDDQYYDQIKLAK